VKANEKASHVPMSNNGTEERSVPANLREESARTLAVTPVDIARETHTY
jgi:hypothetical protein